MRQGSKKVGVNSQNNLWANVQVHIWMYNNKRIIWTFTLQKSFIKFTFPVMSPTSSQTPGKPMESCCSLNTLSPCVNLYTPTVGTTQAVPWSNSKSVRLEGYWEASCHSHFSTKDSSWNCPKTHSHYQRCFMRREPPNNREHSLAQHRCSINIP